MGFAVADDHRPSLSGHQCRDLAHDAHLGHQAGHPAGAGHRPSVHSPRACGGRKVIPRILTLHQFARSQLLTLADLPEQKGTGWRPSRGWKGKGFFVSWRVIDGPKDMEDPDVDHDTV